MLFYSKYENFIIKIAKDYRVKFRNRFYRTNDSYEIKRLKELEQENDSFWEMKEENFSESDDVDESAKKESKGWKNQLKESDDIGQWDDKTLDKFKNGEDIKRCEKECGYATFHGGALYQHEKYCDFE